MNNYHNRKFVERYEDVVFDLETALVINVANNAHQKKDGHRFVVDISGEVTPFDWYNARLSVHFKVNKLADGANLGVADHNGIVNGGHSFIKNIDVKMNGYQVYDCNDVNHVVNIKNSLENSDGYASSTATNKFFFLDTNRRAEERVANANFNKGFAARKALLGVSATVNTEIPLNRYSFIIWIHENGLISAKILREVIV